MTPPEQAEGFCLVGNSHVRWCRVVDGVPVVTARHATGDLLSGLAQPPKVTLTFGVSVVPAVEELPCLAHLRWLRAAEAPMPTRYVEPSTLGTDRIANAWGAWRIYGGPVLVVDAGTATTFTLVDAEGVLAGGAITLGVGATLEALAARGARLPIVPPALPPPGPALTTEGAILKGVVGGHAGLIRGLASDLAAGVPVILTGGAAVLLYPLLPGVLHVPDLQARGAMAWWEAV
ncbi:MAG: type III pantothenate kinase [Candidatus Sericytochromatia bacterium]|nr:type III pantothenate kinase [Candidatus Sericytochromatia bacterium]